MFLSLLGVAVGYLHMTTIVGKIGVLHGEEKEGESRASINCAYCDMSLV